MTAKPTCPHTKQLTGLVDRTLPDDHQTELQQHVDECEVCEGQDNDDEVALLRQVQSLEFEVLLEEFSA